MSQDTVFRQGESDRYFQRNQSALTADERVAHDAILQVLQDAQVRPASALEVGAANGFRLAALQGQTGCHATAIEPSAAAIQDGQRRYPKVRYVQALAHELGGFASGEFDLVIASFVLHWVDRSRLLETAAALDRVLADNGWLVISDFLPDRPQRIRYHHLPDADVWTYKQDYAALWLASAIYRQTDRRLYDVRTHQPGNAVPPEQRFAVTLLHKRLGGYESAALPALA